MAVAVGVPVLLVLLVLAELQYSAVLAVLAGIQLAVLMELPRQAVAVEHMQELRAVTAHGVNAEYGGWCNACCTNRCK
jgi:hypothetical protein